MKPELKRKIGLIMDRHPVFSTALIARRCFASKTASNEYHFGRPGIPVTLRELEEKMMRDVSSIDHFKHLAKVMAERMSSAVKGEFASEAKSIKTEVEKLLKGDEPTVNNTSAKSKRASNKENNVVDDKEDAPVKTNAKSETPKRESKRGSQKSASSSSTAADSEKAPSTPASRGGRKNAVNDVGSKASAKKDAKKPAAKSAAAPEAPAPAAEVEDNKCDICRNVILPPMYQCLENHLTCHLCFQKAVRGYCPVCQNESKRNRRTKKHDNWDTVKKRKQQNENIPNANNDEAAAGNKSEDESKPKSPLPVVPAPASPAKATGGGRKRKNALAPVNSNRGAKMAKTGTAVAASVAGATKIIPVSPGSKIALAGNSLVSISSLSHPLPPQVVLPTTPVAANQVQNIRTSAPPAQVIQLRPTGTVAAAGMPPGSMQIRPLRMASGVGPRPQFYKIVGGKPVQMSNLQRLPGAIQPPPGSRVVYMRAPGPTSQASTGAPLINAVTSVASAITSTAASGSTVTTAATPTGNKIILLANKGQAIPVSKGASGAPSIVRIVSPNSLTTAGGKLTLAPSSPGKMALKPAPGTTGPILLRTVAPRPVVSSAGTPIQLPMSPLPKSALTSGGGGGPEKKTQANDTAKAIQVLLPKSPLPPTAAGLSPQKSPPMAMTTTTTTNANGSFVWTNSTRANFKLSSRINFASLDKFRYVNNKDVQFVLASIVTEDKSNEFSFKLHLKREPAAKGKKQAEQESYLELEGKAKVPTAQEWSLKVKTEPPVFLVSKGNFMPNFAAVRIPKEIAEKPFVDYELHIDKCSPMQVAAAASAAAAAAATAAPPPAKRGRKAAAAAKN